MMDRSKLKTVWSVLGVVLLGGCATDAPVTPSARLIGPPAWAMTTATPLPDPQPKEDAKALLGQCRAAYGTETAKLQPLQVFATRVTKKAKD